LEVGGWSEAEPQRSEKTPKERSAPREQQRRRFRGKSRPIDPIRRLIQPPRLKTARLGVARSLEGGGVSRAWWCLVSELLLLLPLLPGALVDWSG